MFLGFSQWPLQPVGAGFALFQGDAAELFDQLQITQAGAKSAQRGGGLGVEYRCRYRPAAGLERLQVFTAGMHDLQHLRIFQQRLQYCGHVGFAGINQTDLIADDDLNQCQLRIIGAFTDELGVHADQAGISMGL